MKAKYKAKELMQKAYDLDKHNKTTQSRCKQIALLCVDEIIKELTEEISPSVHGFRHQYWKEVKQEIEKL